jgi:hypothetical protein
VTSRYDAAVAEENARQNLRELQAAGKATQADADRVKDAAKAYDKASGK